MLILAAVPILLAISIAALSSESFSDCPQCPEMVPIPAGEFFMGATQEELRVAALPAHFGGREQPRHVVQISKPYAVSKYEVSVALYAQFIEDTGYAPADGCWVFIGSEFIFDESRSWREAKLKQSDDHPVTCVSWLDAVTFAGWLSQQSGQNYRLLSESEWEYAARAGTETAYWFGSSVENVCKYVNLGDIATREEFGWHETVIKYAPLSNWHNEPCLDGYATTAPVTFGSPNAFGLYNMLGNVQELVADCWHKDYASGPTTEAPRQLSGDCGYRPMRGQGWTAIAAGTRSSFRAKMLATDRRFYLGIRVARDVPTHQ